jgi:TonB family protein
MITPAMPKAAAAEKASAPKPDILPTLFGEGYGNYQIRPTNFLVSFVLHSVALALLIWSGYWVAEHRQEIKAQITEVFSPTDVSPYVLKPAPDKAGGGGGGGDRDKFQASKGALPKQSLQQLAPPAVVIRNENPKLPVDASVVVPPSITLPHNGALGDPMSNILGPASSGTGYGGGIGSGSGGGVGSGRGPGVGPGWGGGIGGGVYRVGGGVSAPRALYAPDPEYSEEARKSKYQGVVVLWVVIGPDGRPHDIRVQRSLGMGLDEKAVEAVKLWKFEPARKDGQAVPVQINVEVNFRLY